VLVGCGGGGGGSNQNETLRIGALLSLTGGWSSLGQTSQAAMQVAADDVNVYLHDIGSDLRVEVEVADTELDPDLASVALQRFARQGVRIVIGPQSSAEVRAVKPIADDRGVLVICDTRLATMGYGRRLLAALPPMQPIRSEEDLVAALQALTRTSTTDHAWS